MEQIIAQAKEQFEQILSYIQGNAKNQQLHDVEKNIFWSLLKLGLTLLALFFQVKGVGHRGRLHVDKRGVQRPYHSIKCKMYRSIFGKIDIPRACYWAKGESAIYPLDAELNLPSTEDSYVLQEWAAVLGAEEAYEKAARFLETILGTPLWGSSIENIVRKAHIDVQKFYEERVIGDEKSEESILVATIDGKGIIMRKDQLEKRPCKKRLRRARKLGEREKKTKGKTGKKKMSTVIGVYTIAPERRTAGDLLNKEGKQEESPRPRNKVLQATLKGKDIAAKRLMAEVNKRDPERKKQGVALVDGEHKLRELIKAHLPWLTVIIDIYHVMEHLWRGAHVFHQENSSKAECWMEERLALLLQGRVEEVIAHLKGMLKSLSQGRKKRLQNVITYLENGKEHMHYDMYLSEGYPIGSGVVEGACRNLVKDRMEQCGMHWTVDGAEAILSMRSIQVNKMTCAYWHYHIYQESQRLYGEFTQGNPIGLVA